MSWIDLGNLDNNELNKEVEKAKTRSDNGFKTEPGVYDVVVSECYLQKTQGGTSFINFTFLNGESKIFVNNWDVNRMVSKSNGDTKTSKGNFFNGLVLLKELTDSINGIEFGSLKPVNKFREVFGEQVEIGSFDQLLNKKVSVGIRTRVRYNEWEGEVKRKEILEIVGFCNTNDKECKDKMASRIEKNPVLEDKKPAGSTQTSNVSKPSNDNNEDLPF